MLNNTTSPNVAPTDWEGVSLDHVIARLKLNGLRPFFKSYRNWDKMTIEKKTKHWLGSVSFRNISEEFVHYVLFSHVCLSYFD
jgi:hypothetical protein